jgi:hypothetical protein
MKGIILLGLFFVLLAIVLYGCGVHPTCTSHCDQRPEYWYNLPAGGRYTEAYQVTVDGKPLPPVNHP